MAFLKLKVHWNAGTGITPMLQVIEELLDQVEDTTKFTLLYCSQSPEEIILKSHIDELVSMFPERLTVLYVIDKPVDGWSGLTGYVTADMIAATMPGPAAGVGVFVCGPPPMYKAVCGPKGDGGKQGELAGFLKDAGYTTEMVFKF